MKMLTKVILKCRRSMAVLLLLCMVLQSTIAYADADDFTASPSEVEKVVGENEPNNSATPSVTGNIADEDDETPDLTEYPEEPEEASPSDAEELEDETPTEESEEGEIASPSNSLGGLGFAMENEGGTLLGVINISVTTYASPSQIIYNEGENFDPTGWIVKVYYQNTGGFMTTSFTDYLIYGDSQGHLTPTGGTGASRDWVYNLSSNSTNLIVGTYSIDLTVVNATYSINKTVSQSITVNPKSSPSPTPTPSSGSSGSGGGGGGTVSPAGKILDPQIVSPGIITNPLDPNAVLDPTLIVQQVVIPPTPVPTETKIQINYDINTKKKVEVSKNPSVGHDDSGNAKLNLTGMDGVTYIADFGFYDVETKNATTNYGGHIDTYYVNEASNLISGWIETANKNRYFMENVRDNNEGKMCHGWKRIVSDWYYFDYDGTMMKGKQTYDGFTVDGAGKMTNPSILDQTLINGAQQNIVYTMSKGYQHN